MTSFIVFCLVVAVVWLFNRVKALCAANDEVRGRLNLLGQRLQKMEAVQKGALVESAIACSGRGTRLHARRPTAARDRARAGRDSN